MIKITVAIPTYNNSDVLDKALLSSLNQNVPENVDYNVLVVNNASDDNTIEILEKYNSYSFLKVVNNIETVSQFENHNICLRESDSDYLIYCHSDDELYLDALMKIERELRRYQYPEKFVCWGRSFYRDFGKVYRTIAPINQLVSGFQSQELFQYGGLTPSGTCFSRDSFLKAGGFLPMHSNTTPSDMSSMINFSLYGAEFLMTDRILFKRQLASTADNLSKERLRNDFDDAISELVKSITPQQLELLIENISYFGNKDIRYISSLERYSQGKLFKLKIRALLDNPKLIINKQFFKILLDDKR